MIPTAFHQLLSRSSLSYRARYYNPNIGRFVSEDPMKDGPNFYTYVSNSPILMKDPSGEQAVQCKYLIENGETGGECPHEVFTVFFNLCNAVDTITDPEVRRCVRKKCKPKQWEIKCLCASHPCCQVEFPTDSGPPQHFMALTPRNSGGLSLFCPSNWRKDTCPGPVLAMEMMQTCRHAKNSQEDAQMHALVDKTVPCLK